jgi:hypothetical protein
MNMTVKTTGIQKRGNKFYLRIRIPEDCKKSLSGKREIIKSLGTDDEIEALTQATMLRAEWQETFKQIRERQENGVNAKPTVTPSGKPLEDELQEELHAIAYRSVSETLYASNLTECRHVVEESIRPQLKKITNALAADDLSQVTLSLIHGYILPSHLVIWTFAVELSVQNDRRALRVILRVLRNELQFMEDEIYKEFPQLDTVTREDAQRTQKEALGWSSSMLKNTHIYRSRLV